MWLRRYFGMSVLVAAAFSATSQSLVREPRPVTHPVPGSAAALLRKEPGPIVISDKPSRAGNLGVTVTDRMRQREERAKYLQALSKKRVSGSARLEGMAIYQPRDGGTPVLTNRIEKYEARKRDYTRIKFKFDPRILKPVVWGPTTGHFTNTDIHKYVEEFAKRYGLDTSLIHAVIWTESRGDPYAESSKGARGLMQLMPGTASDMNVVNIFDPAENIGGGTQYLSKLLGLFNDNYQLALAGYNAGPETVRQYGGIPPFRETQEYVVSVMNAWAVFKKSGNKFDYQKFNPELTPEAMAARRLARLATRELGDAANTTHVVQLIGGEVQHAEKVHYQGDFLYLRSAGRNFRLNKGLISAVDGVSLDSTIPLTQSDLAAVPDATVPLPHDDSVRLAAQI